MPKVVNLTADQVAAKLAYDPETGVFTWKIAPSKKIRAGAVAGSVKGQRISARKGTTKGYTYIRFEDLEMPAARFAWLLSYGKWPEGLILFKDGDPSNLRLDNLKEAMFKTKVYVSGDGRRVNKMSHDAARHYGLKRFYGLTLQEYGEMLVAQNGVCAICQQKERAVVHGKVKPLSVDHCHATGQNRGLLCSHCNHGIGHFMENRDVLLSAIKYLDHHNGDVAEKPALTVVDGKKE